MEWKSNCTDMEWEDIPTISCSQQDWLEKSRDRAVRLKMARAKKRQVMERLQAKEKQKEQLKEQIIELQMDGWEQGDQVVGKGLSIEDHVESER